MKNIEIRQKIYGLIEDRYYSSVSECVLPNDPETDEYLENAIEEMLERTGVRDYKVWRSDCFDSPGYECGTVSVCWIGDEGLDMEVIEWEVM